MEGTISLAGVSLSGCISCGGSLVGEISQSVVNVGVKLLPATRETLGGVIVGANLSITSEGVLSANAQEVPIATRDVAGKVKVGDGFDRKSDGTISVPKATRTIPGIFSVGEGLDISDGRVSVGDISNKIPAQPKASKTTFGVVKIGDNLIIKNGVLSATPSASISVDSVMNSTSANPVQNKVINSALSGKVDKQSGKGLSTNDFTNAEKTKLGNLTNYSTMTAAEASGGTVTEPRVVSPKVLSDTIDSKVSDAVAGLVVPGAAVFQKAVNSNSDISNLTSYKKGYYWVVATAGTYMGQSCEVGDMIFCVSDRATAYNVNDFNILQNNIVAISNSEIDTITA